MVAGLLADRLADSLLRRMGADQHVELAGLVREAGRTVVAPGTGRALQEVAHAAPWTVESNLDLVEWPETARWYELPGAFKGAPEGDDPVLGLLLLPHPEGPGLYILVTAIETSLVSARHCYATALIDAGQLGSHAVVARRMYSKTPDESLERLMSMIGVTMTEDFRDEVLISEDGNEAVVEALMRDATAQVPLLLALLVAERSAGARLDGEGSFVCEPEPPRGRLAKLSDRLASRQSGGFVRLPAGRRREKLAFHR